MINETVHSRKAAFFLPCQQYMIILMEAALDSRRLLFNTMNETNKDTSPIIHNLALKYHGEYPKSLYQLNCL